MKSETSTKRTPYFEVGHSRIQGLGAFATCRIRRGTRLIEYLGERISPEEADRRYADDVAQTSHVLLFTVNNKTIIDWGVAGNEARFINHSCEPNCEAVVEHGHIFIESLKTIEIGDELTYDYNLTWDEPDEAELKVRYPCYCGFINCRGTQLKQGQ